MSGFFIEIWPEIWEKSGMQTLNIYSMIYKSYFYRDAPECGIEDVCRRIPESCAQARVRKIAADAGPDRRTGC